MMIEHQEAEILAWEVTLNPDMKIGLSAHVQCVCVCVCLPAQDKQYGLFKLFQRVTLLKKYDVDTYEIDKEFCYLKLCVVHNSSVVDSITSKNGKLTDGMFGRFGNSFQHCVQVYIFGVIFSTFIPQRKFPS